MNDNSLLVSVMCFTIMYIIFQCVHFYENYYHIINTNERNKTRTMTNGKSNGEPTMPSMRYDPTRQCIEMDGKTYLFSSERGLGFRDAIDWHSLEDCKDHLLGSDLRWEKDDPVYERIKATL